MQPYGRQLLIGEHGDCAPPEAAQRLAAHFRALARGHGLTTLRNLQRVKCTLSGCLGVCAGGPILVVYPDGTWYHYVDDALLERILTEHLLADRPVEAHIFHRLGADGSVPPEADPHVYAPDYSGDAPARSLTALAQRLRVSEADTATVVDSREEDPAPVALAPAAAPASPLLPMTGLNGVSSAPKTLLNRRHIIVARKRTIQ
jgi:(2Fe-2S) ferredoxin